jgi:hypothetical protein
MQRKTVRYHLKRLKSVGMVCALVMSGLLALTRSAKAQGFSSSVFLPNEIVSGNTYSEWAAKWNPWFVSIPASINPSLDTSGKFCDESQRGSVFFLAGSGVGTVKRSCTVPCGKPLFFPLITAECSSVEPNPFFGATPADRLICAQQLVDLVDIASLETKIDGVAVTSLNRFRVAGPDTSFRMSPDDNVLGVSASSGFSTADGYWLMLKPLSPGSHALHFASTLDGFSQNVTYDLTVKGSC